VTESADHPDTEVFRQVLVRKPRKPWTCTRCKKVRPARLQRMEWAGKIDGKYVEEHTCAEVQNGATCPFEARSWPLWRLHFEPDPHWPKTHGSLDKPYAEIIRAPHQSGAEAHGHDVAALGFRFVRVVKLDDGTPDTGEAA
jgi:hypothetical protein